MISRNEAILARKYAQAFMQVFKDQVSYDQAVWLQQLGTTLHDASVMSLMTIAAYKNPDILFSFLETLRKKDALADPLIQLTKVLLHDKRVRLLPQVLQLIAQLYKQQHRSIDFVVTSSHPLDARERTIVENFLKYAVEGNPHFIYNIDEKLIAGIRAQSETLLWEYSLDQQIKALSRL